MGNYMDKIEINPNIMLGKPVIKGTRITVEAVLEEFGAGKDMQDLLKSYPHLDADAVWAAFRFAADALRGERVYPIGF